MTGITDFENTLLNWKRDPQTLSALFSPDEVRQLDAARLGTPFRTVVFCVYENFAAKSGGIFAVAEHLPPALAALHNEVIVLSPWHSKLKTALSDSDYEKTRIIRRGTFAVSFGGSRVQVEML